MNTDKCKECNSTSLEKCLKIQCPYFMNIKRDKNEDKEPILNDYACEDFSPESKGVK